MRISEIFHSIQGEGKLLGLPSVFVRVSGCNLRCTWCDTPYASWHPEGEQIQLPEILTRVRAYGCSHVVLTGGEPLVMPEIEQLCFSLAAERMHVTVETAGTIYKPLPVDLVSLSPKLSNSTPDLNTHGQLAIGHEKRRLNVPVLQQFIDTAPDLQFKFVIQTPADLDEVQQILAQLRGWHPQDVLLMPEGNDPDLLAQRSQWLVDQCRERGFRFCPRLHVMIWGNRRGV
jgi:7-carboxy-7-deazaguanine synthase